MLLEKVPARVTSLIQSQLSEIPVDIWGALVGALIFILFTVFLLCDKRSQRLIMQTCVVRE